MGWKKILAIGLGIVLIAEACYFGWLWTKTPGAKENNPIITPAKTGAPNIPPTNTQPPLKHTYLRPGQAKPDNIAVWEEDVRQNPQLVDKRWLLAQAYMLTLDQRNKALPHLEALLQLQPDHPEIKLIRFWLDMLKPKESKAPPAYWQKLQELKKKLAENPKQPEVLLEMAQVYQSQGMFESMDIYAKQAATGAKDNGEIVWAIAKLYEAEEEYDKALQYLQAAKRMKLPDSRRQEIEHKMADLSAKKEDVQGNNVAVLEANLKSQERVTRQRAIRKLAQNKNDAAAVLLLQFVQQVTDEEEQTQAIRSLCQLNTLSVQAGIPKILADAAVSAMLKNKIRTFMRMPGRKQAETSKNQGK